MEDFIKHLKDSIAKQPYHFTIYGFLFGVVVGFFCAFIIFSNKKSNNIDLDTFSVIENAGETDFNRGKALNEINEEDENTGYGIDYHITGVYSEKSCVDIAGAVMKPGVYCLEPNARIVDVLDKAGGFDVSNYASEYVSRKFNFAQIIADEQKIYIPYSKEVVCTLYGVNYLKDDELLGNDILVPPKIDNSNPFINEPSLNPIEEGGQGESCININTASKDQLISMPGVGESTAQKIIDARPFSSNQDLLTVSGIGEAKYSEMATYLCK